MPMCASLYVRLNYDLARYAYHHGLDAVTLSMSLAC